MLVSERLKRLAERLGYQIDNDIALSKMFLTKTWTTDDYTYGHTIVVFASQLRSDEDWAITLVMREWEKAGCP